MWPSELENADTGTLDSAEEELAPAPSFLVVAVSGRVVALPLTQVREVLRIPALIPAGSAPGVLGTAMLRGSLVPVLELAVLLGLPVGQASAGRRLVSVAMGERAAALAVDEVVGVRSLAVTTLTKLSWPGGEEHRMGEFDGEFARLIEGGGLVPEATWSALAEGAS